MKKDNLNDLNGIDIMSFLQSMSNMQGGIPKPKKSKKKNARCTIKEEDNVYIKECEEDGEEETVEGEEGDAAKSKKKTKDVIKNVDKVEEDEEDDDEEEEDEEEDDEEDDDDDDEDEEEEEEEDEDDDEEDEEGNEAGAGMNSEDLYNIFNNFFTDEYGVSIATSLSNIAFELNKLNKNLKSKKEK